MAVPAALALLTASTLAHAQTIRADPDRSANPVTGAGGESTPPAIATPSGPVGTPAPGSPPADTMPQSTGSVSTYAPGNPPPNPNASANPVTGAGGGSSPER